MREELVVLVAEDSKIFCAGLRQAFSKANLYIRLFEAGNINELLLAIHNYKPQVIFLNIVMHLDNEKRLLNTITARSTSAKIIILYDSFHKRFVQELFYEPVHGFLCKSSAEQEFLNAINQVIKEGAFYCNETLHTLSSFLFQSKNTTAFPIAVSFTEREKQIISLICNEYTAKEIADKLSLSKRTVENRKVRILEKMHVKNIAGIVAYAYKNNIVNLNV